MTLSFLGGFVFGVVLSMFVLVILAAYLYPWPDLDSDR